MANVLLTFAHPNPDSLNGATARSIESALREKGHTVRFNDLYRTDFDPKLGFKDFEQWGNGKVPADVKAMQEDIAWADGLVFVYPNWWNGRPALLKGYIDRVYTKGFAWDFGPNGLEGKLKGKQTLVAVTSGTPKELYQGLGIPTEHLHNHMELGTLKFCGIEEVRLVETYGILSGDESLPKAHINDATDAAVALFA